MQDDLARDLSHTIQCMIAAADAVRVVMWNSVTTHPEWVPFLTDTFYDFTKMADLLAKEYVNVSSDPLTIDPFITVFNKDVVHLATDFTKESLKQLQVHDLEAQLDVKITSMIRRVDGILLKIKQIDDIIS